MLDIISIIVISLLIYILLVVLLNFIQASSWGGVKIKLKNKKMIGKEQPIYSINDEKRISKYEIDYILCENLNIVFFMFVPILFIFKKLEYTRVGGFYITNSEYNSINTSDDLEYMYNKYFETLNEVHLEEENKLNQLKLKLEKLNEKFDKNYGKQ